jgi:hypothetical protein
MNGASTRRDYDTRLERPVRGVRLPQTFGPYLLIERIGAGGMADVFRAMAIDPSGRGVQLAVKRMRPELGEAPDFVRMFTDEARITAMLDHPNIVRVFDFGRVDDSYYLAMEHIDGKDLSSVMLALRSAGLSLRAAPVAQICLDVARGLDYAHTLRDANGGACEIVHRDINPSNVMLTRAGGVKILDFGVVKASANLGKMQTQYGRIKGKLGYLSPEQARGEPVDARSDIFSLGIMMWEMLTGCRLFWAKNGFERIQRVLYAPVAAPSVYRSTVPPALDRIVLRALERDPARRYASVRELAADLEDLLRGGPPIRPDAIAYIVAMLFGGRTADGGDARTSSGPGALAPASRRARRGGALRWAITATVVAAALSALPTLLTPGRSRVPVPAPPAAPAPLAPTAQPARSIIVDAIPSDAPKVSRVTVHKPAHTPAHTPAHNPAHNPAQKKAHKRLRAHRASRP